MLKWASLLSGDGLIWVELADNRGKISNISYSNIYSEGEFYGKERGDGKHPLAVRHMFEYFLAQPFPELDDAFLMAGWAEMPALAGKRQQIFMPAIAAPHPGKSQVQVPAVQIPANHVPDIGPEKSVLTLKTVIPHHFQILKMK